MACVLVIGLILMEFVEAFVRKKADSGELFKNVGKYKDKNGNYHDFDYYYDEVTKKYERIGK